MYAVVVHYLDDAGEFQAGELVNPCKTVDGLLEIEHRDDMVALLSVGPKGEDLLTSVHFSRIGNVRAEAVA
jgi:hypothetical protein